MTADLKLEAKEVLKGNWGTFAVVTFITMLFQVVIVAVAKYVYGASLLADLLVIAPLSLGIFSMNLAIVNKSRKVEVGNMFSGFSDYGRIIEMALFRFLFTLLWTLLLIIPGIIKSIAYNFAEFIMLDDKTITGRQALKKSEEMMLGHKWEFFVLMLSFILWWILCIISFGIATLWVVPYVNTTNACFYKKIVNDNKVIPILEDTENTNSVSI